MPGEGLRTLAEQLEAETGGQVVLLPQYDAPDGLRSATIPAAVRDGRIEVGDAFAGSLAALDPWFQLSSLPFVATNAAAARALYDAARPLYAGLFAAMGQQLLFATPWPATGLWSRRPVTGPDDLRGLRVRTYDSTSTTVLRRAGAAPVELSFADAMPRLADGTVDAVLSSGDGGAGRRLWDFLPHFTEIGYAMPLSLATVSQSALDRLDTPLRRGAARAAERTEEVQWRRLADRTEANYARMRQNGVTIAPPSPTLAAALAEAGQGAVENWQAQVGPRGAELLRQAAAGRASP